MDTVSCLVIILIIFKFCGVLTCPWWAVFTPILFPLVLILTIAISALLLNTWIEVIKK